jgi:hypothetical protein
VFQEDGAADIIITPSAHKDSDRERLAARRIPTSRFVLTVPAGVKIDLSSGAQAVHYPLRASELLECFDQLESEWPFPAAPLKTATVVTRQTVAPTAAQTTRLVAPRTTQQLWEDPRLSQASPTISHAATDFRLSQTLTDAPSSQMSHGMIDSRLSHIPEGRTLTVGVTNASGRGVLAHPATVGALIQALRSLRSSQEGERPQGRCIDIFDQAGWIGRLYNGRNKVYASRRFMLDRSAEPAGGRLFHWRFTLSGLPPLSKGDALIEVDIDLLAWQLSARFCYDFATLDLPINALLHLRRWPDFGVHPEFSSRPGVMLATALLTRQTMSLAALHRESEASEVNLACLLGVCWLSGWLRCEREMPKTPPSKAPAEKTRFSGIVRSLRKVLGLRG